MKRSSLIRKLTGCMLTLSFIVVSSLSSFVAASTDTTEENIQTVYLSDLNWESATHGDYTTSYSVQKDKEFASGNAGGNQKISLRISDTETRTFDKGISTVASSKIVYDISGKGFSAFSTYVGVDAVTLNDYNNSSGTYQEGIVEWVKISIDNEVVFETGRITPAMNASFVNVEIPANASNITFESNAGAVYWADVVDFADAKFTWRGEPGTAPNPINRLIRLEAEDAINNASTQGNSNASGGYVLGNFDHAIGTYAEFNTIFVPTSGTYTVNLGYVAPGNTVYSLYVNGVSTSRNASGTGNWNTFSKQTFDVQLNEGINTIKFVSIASTLMDLDYIEVVGAVDVPLQEGWIEVADSSNEITYTGTWSAEGKSASRGGSAKLTAEVGATATLTFTGTGFQWIGKEDPNFGSVKLYVDDVFIGQQSAKNKIVLQKNLYTLIGLPYGEHTVKMEYIGGASGNGYGIELDSLAYTSNPTEVSVDTLTISPLSSRLKPGQTVQLSASAMNGTDHVYSSGLTYFSSNSSIATVDAITGLVTAVADGTATITATYAGHTQSATVIVKTPVVGDKRIQVSNEQPLLIVPIYGERYDPVSSKFQWQDTLLGRWNAIPDDIKPYSIIEIHSGAIGIRNEAEIKAFYDQQMEIAEKHNIPVALLTVTAGNAQQYTGTYYLDTEWAQEMYDKYSTLVALMSSENYWIYGDHIANLAAGYIDVSAKNGGYFIWSEQNPGGTVEKAVANSNFQRAMKEHGDSFIFTFKTTPASVGTSPETSSYMAGLWLTDYVGQWGGLIDTWSWWERKNWRLFEPSMLPGGGAGGEEARTVASVPEATLAIEMMNIYLSGGTVYNFEHPAYTTGVEDLNTPAFENAIVDFLRYVIKHPAPTKQEVLAQTKIVVHDNIGRVGGSNFYKGLNSEDPTFATYTTGRYGIIPVIPSSIPRSAVTEAFPATTILTGDSSQLANKQSKINFFNSVYPERYTGDAFAQNLEDRWYVYNSNINVNIDQSAKFNLSQSSVEVEVLLEPHSYIIFDDKANTLNVKLNNYRVDKDSIWEGYTNITPRWNPDVNNLFQDWIKEHYMKNTEDNVMRTTILKIANLETEPFIKDITGLIDQYEQPHVDFDAETGIATITILSNGYMDFKVILGVEDNKLNLAALINEAQTKHDMSTEGVAPGQYPKAAREALQTAIHVAIGIFENMDATQAEVDEAINQLNKALTIFINSVVKEPSGQLNLTELEAAISNAEKKYVKAVEGTKIGQYVIGTKTILRAAIDTAKYTSFSSQAQVDQAVSTLNMASQVFSMQLIVLVNGQTKVTINDLSLLVKYYGTKHTDANWSLVEIADINGEHEININVLAAVAQIILDDWRKE